MTTRRIEFVFDGNTRGLDQALGGAREKMKKFGAGMRRIGTRMSVGVTAPVLAFGGAAFKAASDAVEAKNKMSKVFGDNAKEIKKWSKTSSAALISPRSEVIQNVATFGSMFKAMELGQDETVEFSTTLVDAAADMASFNNADPSQMLTAFRSALSNEFEPLKKYGVLLNVAKVKQKAMEMGLIDAKGELDDAARAQATYQLILDKTSQAHGDVADTIDDPANKMRNLRTRMKNFVTTVGERLLPIGEKLLGWFEKGFDWLERLDPKWQKFGLLAAAVAAAVGPLLIVLGSLVGAIAALASPIGAVVLGVAALVAAFVIAYNKSERFREIVNGVATFLKDTVWPTIQRVVDFIVEKFQEFAPKVREVVDDVIEWFRELFRSTEDIWSQISEAIEHFINVAAGIIRTTVDFIKAMWRAWGDDLFTIAKSIFEFIKETIENAIRVISGIIRAVLAIINGDWSGAWNAIKDVAGAIWDQITNIIETAIDTLGAMLGGFVSTAAEILKGLRDAFASPINWVIRNVINKFLGAIESVANALGLSLDLPEVPEINTGGGAAGAPAMGPGGGGGSGMSWYHEGGIAGVTEGSRKGRTGPLANDEMVAVLQRGEGIIPRKIMDKIGEDGFHRVMSGNDEMGGAFDFVGDAIDAVGDGASFVAEKVRGVIAQTAKPLVHAAMAAMDATIGRFGTPGELVGGAVRRLGDLVLEWIGGVDGEAETRIGRLPPGSPPYRRLIEYMAESGVAHRVTSTFRPGDPGFHGAKRAADFAGPVPSRDSEALARIFRAFEPVEDRLKELIYAGPQVGYNIRHGRRVGKYAMAGHHDHVHVALAEGGIVTEPTRALIGESGPEAVMPLDPLHNTLLAIVEGLRLLIERATARNEGQTEHRTAFDEYRSAFGEYRTQWLQQTKATVKEQDRRFGERTKDWTALHDSFAQAESTLARLIDVNRQGFSQVTRAAQSVSTSIRLGLAAVAVPGAAEGALVKSRPGGTLVRVGEGGEDEIIAPLSKVRSSRRQVVIEEGAVQVRVTGGDPEMVQEAVDAAFEELVDQLRSME